VLAEMLETESLEYLEAEGGGSPHFRALYTKPR